MNKFIELYREACGSEKNLEHCFMTREEFLGKIKTGHLYAEIVNERSLSEKILTFPVIIKNPYMLGLYEAFSRWDMEHLNNVLYQAARYNAIQTCGLSSGYDHCGNFYPAIQAFAANDLKLADSLFPKELGMSKNGHAALVTGTNLLMALRHKDESMLEKKAYGKAKKFISSKRTILDTAMIEYLLSLAENDTKKASLCLKDICAGIRKSKAHTALEKCFCVHAHGLYNFAYHVLPPQDSSKIELPDDENFIKDLAEWNLDNGFKCGKLFFNMPDELRLMDYMLTIEVPKCSLIKKYDNSNTLYTDIDKFRKELITAVSEAYK